MPNISISLPDGIYRKIEDFAVKNHVSRSQAITLMLKRGMAYTAQMRDEEDGVV